MLKMRKIIAALLSFILVIIVLLVYNKNDIKIDDVIPYQPPKKNISFNESLLSVNKEGLKSILYFLTSSDLEGRMSGKKGNDLAKDYIFRYYSELGYTVSLQEFAIQNLNNYKEQGSGRTCNVIAVLSGNDVNLSDETVVIGAHYDHIGYGPSMSQTPQRREIHPGADDNASGTTALLGAAKRLSMMKGKNKRRIVFISFSAEEMGLIGAKYYVNNPKHTNMVFMLNMDMVGRLNGNKEISALGAGSSVEVSRVIEGLSGYPFKARITSGSGGGSDHVPFYQKSIPVCFLHTGMHNDYHTPDDTANKIDFDGLVWVSRYAANIVWEVSNLSQKPTFKGVIGIGDNDFIDHDWKR